MFKLGQFNILAAKVGISGFVLGGQLSFCHQRTSDAREKEFLWPPAPYHRNSEIPPRHVAVAFLKWLKPTVRNTLNDAKWFTHTSTHKKLKLDFTKQLTVNNM